MAYQVTQNDLSLMRQKEQKVFLKVELLNKNFKVIESLDGEIVSDSFSQNSESKERRSYNFDIVVLNSTFFIGKDKKIWLDKRIRVYYGLYSIHLKEIVWYKLGIFAYNSLSYQYSLSTRLLSLSCPDLMALYDGTLNGELGGFGSSNSDSAITASGLKIPAGEDIRQSIIATLKDAGITNYIVQDIQKEVPYDLEFGTGVTYADVWIKLRDLYDNWEFFFDIDGAFIWRKIPTCLEDAVILDDSTLQPLIIDEKIEANFNEIYNVTEVWGKVLKLEHDDRYAELSTYTDNVYHVSFNDYTSWDDVDHLTQFGIKICSDNLDSPYFSINNYSPIPIYDGDGIPLKSGELKANTIYVFRYRRITVNDSGNVCALYLLGQYQCHGLYEETSKICPYSTTTLGYKIIHSVDYDSLSDDAACYNQAEYLTYKSTAMMDTVTLTLPIIPWLEVNTKLSYTTKMFDTTNQYIIKSITWSTGGTMSLVLYKFLEDFSFVYNRKK